VLALLAVAGSSCGSTNDPGTEWLGPVPDVADDTDNSLPSDATEAAASDAKELQLAEAVPEYVSPPADLGQNDIDAESGDVFEFVPADTSETHLPDISESDTAPDMEVVAPCTDPQPILFVHGVNGSSANYEVMIQRFLDDGWPADYLHAFDAEDPKWGCNVDNAAAIAELVEQIKEQTGSPRVDLVAHSMGTMSSRYYVKFLNGHESVSTYVTMGGMHHGLSSPCWAPDFLGVCVWQELCESGAFITALNAPPVAPGGIHFVSIFSTADETVPAASSFVEGAENIEFQGIDHAGPNGLQQHSDVYDEVKRVLEYPCF